MSDKEIARVDQNVYLTFERLDDDQIVAEMKGACLNEYVYHFHQNGQHVYGLSKSGTDDACRYMAVQYGEVIRELDVVIEHQDDDAA